MYLKLIVFCWTVCLEKVLTSRDLTLEPGHLKPFGTGPSQPVEEIDYFPTAKEFFETYVKPLKPVKMKGVARMSAAFGKWTDDYFLEQEEPAGNTISVETVKKESRQQRVDNMSFKEFVRIYNNTEHYMVDQVPGHLKHDVMVPCPLQCEQLAQNDFVDNVMWYSSGGTKSVVHTDSVENINCLYRGDKTLIFVDPGLFGHKVDLDRPQGSYSAMDVDSVDYTKYPGMADVHFYHVNITAGDCLYIPYQWIHQVRSYGSNLAVNIWWKHHLSTDLDYSRCTDPCNPSFTLAEANFEGFGELTADPMEIKGHIIRLVEHGDMDMKKLISGLIGPEIAVILQKKINIMPELKEIFTLLDADKNAVVTKEEMNSLPLEVWEQLGDILADLEGKLTEAFGDGDGEIDIDGKGGPYGHQGGPNDHPGPLDGDSDEPDVHEEL